MSAHIYPRAALGQGSPATPMYISAITIDLASWPGTQSLPGQELWFAEVTVNGRFDASPAADFSDLSFMTGKSRSRRKAPFTLSPGGPGLMTINLDTPYCYTGVGDLLIDWRNNAGQAPGPVSARVISGTSQGMFLTTTSQPPSPWASNGYRNNAPMWITLHY